MSSLTHILEREDLSRRRNFRLGLRREQRAAAAMNNNKSCRASVLRTLLPPAIWKYQVVVLHFRGPREGERGGRAIKFMSPFIIGSSRREGQGEGGLPPPFSSSRRHPPFSQIARREMGQRFIERAAALQLGKSMHVTHTSYAWYEGSLTTWHARAERRRGAFCARFICQKTGKRKKLLPT